MWALRRPVPGPLLLQLRVSFGAGSRILKPAASFELHQRILKLLNVLLSPEDHVPDHHRFREIGNVALPGAPERYDAHAKVLSDDLLRHQVAWKSHRAPHTLNTEPISSRSSGNSSTHFSRSPLRSSRRRKNRASTVLASHGRQVRAQLPGKRPRQGLATGHAHHFSPCKTFERWTPRHHEGLSILHDDRNPTLR